VGQKPLFMVMVLALFLNKITTPRYLSDIELKINGLVLIKEPIELNDAQPVNDQWLLLTHTEKHQQAASQLVESLPRKIAQYTRVQESTVSHPSLESGTILIANPQQEIIAYFTPPFDRNKMKLTYSSVFTHR